MPQHDTTPPHPGVTIATTPTIEQEPLEFDTPLEDTPGDPTSYATRTAKRDAIIEAWRRDTLANVTPARTWTVLGISYVAVLVLSLLLLPQVPAIVVVALATVAAWIALVRLRLADARHRWVATLTPVVDRTTLGGEATILAASVDALAATLRNPRSSVDVRLEAIQTVMSAAAPIMSRSNITPQMATVEGYPAWPEVDRTEMPGQEGDFLSVHLIRVDATAKRLVLMTAEPVLFEETVARVAAEVVPPLRAMEAVIAC